MFWLELANIVKGVRILFIGKKVVAPSSVLPKYKKLFFQASVVEGIAAGAVSFQRWILPNDHD